MIDFSHFIKSRNGNPANDFAVFNQRNTVADKTDVFAAFMVVEGHQCADIGFSGGHDLRQLGGWNDILNRFADDILQLYIQNFRIRFVHISDAAFLIYNNKIGKSIEGRCP